MRKWYLLLLAFMMLANAAVRGAQNRIGEVTEASGQSYIPSAMAAWDNHMTPSTGNVRIPVFMIEFRDTAFSDDVISGEELERAMFSEKEESGISSFYLNASYGSLHLSGDVFSYRAEGTIASYENESGYETLSMEVLRALDDRIDYTVYDSDCDGIIDAYILCIPTGGDADFWYGCQATWYQNNGFTVDGVAPLYYIMCDAQPEREYMDYYFEVIRHEFGHCMGLPDYYKYNSKDWEGMSGVAGYEVMDDMEGDFSQFSKLQLGWLREDQVQVYHYGEEELFTLPAAVNGGCIIIFRQGNEDYQSEYFIIEYDTPEGNFKGVLDEREAGVRIMHVQAECVTDGWDHYYRYNNYSDEYDSSDNGIRVVRLVNDGNGYYHTGDTVSFGEAGLEWYDNADAEPFYEDFTIKIGACNKDEVQIIIESICLKTA